MKSGYRKMGSFTYLPIFELQNWSEDESFELGSGVVAAPFPSFQRRGGRAAAGVVSKKSRSHLIFI